MDPVTHLVKERRFPNEELPMEWPGMTPREGHRHAEVRGTLLPGLFAQRRRKALTQRRLAELAGVAHTSVQQLESLKRGGYPQTILRLSSALGVEPEELVSDKV